MQLGKLMRYHCATPAYLKDAPTFLTSTDRVEVCQRKDYSTLLMLSNRTRATQSMSALCVILLALADGAGSFG